MLDSSVPQTARPLFAALDDALGQIQAGRVVVAFSGGPDSTALLAALVDWRQDRSRQVEVIAAHLDHGLDPASEDRAAAAASLAQVLGVPFRLQTARVLARPGQGLEAAARTHRYRFLEDLRRSLEADWTLTGHHAEDQAETVALRLLRGTNLRGLAGIRASSGRVRRPFLRLRRRQLLAYLESRRLIPVEDETNFDLKFERNLVRHHLLPRLQPAGDVESSESSSIIEAASRLAETTQRTFSSIDQKLLQELLPRTSLHSCRARLAPLSIWPEPLQALAFDLLLRLAGQARPLPRSLAAELRQAIEERTAGRFHRREHGDWTWDNDRDQLSVSTSTDPFEPSHSTCPPFTYTLQVPGTVRIHEIDADFTVERREFEPWMLEGSPWRAALALQLRPGDPLVLRNRRSGDRIRPLGAPGTRRLKDLLIDHKIPRSARDGLPLLCWRDRIVWVPGITIENEFRLTDDSPSWVCQIGRVGPATENDARLPGRDG